MKNKLTNKLFIYAFLFLYALVAFISFCHAIEFFDIGNTHWMSIMLAFAFELGLAVCLASILIGTNKRNNIAWILLTLLVVVQVIGNTYSVFKYISNSDVDYYNYLAKPLLFWIQEVSQETVQIIVSWIMGAILPIVALLMTEMVANGIKETQEDFDEKEVKQIEDKSVQEQTVVSEEPVEVQKAVVEKGNFVDEPVVKQADEPIKEPEQVESVVYDNKVEQDEPIKEPEKVEDVVEDNKVGQVEDVKEEPIIQPEIITSPVDNGTVQTVDLTNVPISDRPANIKTWPSKAPNTDKSTAEKVNPAIEVK